MDIFGVLLFVALALNSASLAVMVVLWSPAFGHESRGSGRVMVINVFAIVVVACALGLR